MSPQTHAFNAGIWSDLESAVRTMAAQNQEICVVTGPVLTDGPYKTIGSSKVSVPNFYYKVILDYYGNDKKAIGFVLSQDDKGKLSGFAVTVDAHLMQASGTSASSTGPPPLKSTATTSAVQATAAAARRSLRQSPRVSGRTSSSSFTRISVPPNARSLISSMTSLTLLKRKMKSYKIVQVVRH